MAGDVEIHFAVCEFRFVEFGVEDGLVAEVRTGQDF